MVGMGVVEVKIVSGPHYGRAVFYVRVYDKSSYAALTRRSQSSPNLAKPWPLRNDLRPQAGWSISKSHMVNKDTSGTFVSKLCFQA